MATPKTLTAEDIEQGKLTIITNGPFLHIERRYSFVDNLAQPIIEWAGGRIVEDVEFSTLPTNIQDALLAIDQWTYQQALMQEGMD